MKKNIAFITALSIFTVSFLVPVAQAQRALPTPTAIPSSPVPNSGSIFVQSSQEGIINLSDPSVGVVIRNEGGDISIGVINPVPSPAPTNAPRPEPTQQQSLPQPTQSTQQNPAPVNPTVAPSSPGQTQPNPTSIPPIQTNPVPSEQPIIIANPGEQTRVEPTQVQPTNTPERSTNPVVNTPTPHIINPVVTTQPTTAPFPTSQPTFPTPVPQAPSIPIIDPIIEIISDIFNLPSRQPEPNPEPIQTGPVVSNPSTSNPAPTAYVQPTQPPLVRVTPTPIPQPTDEPTSIFSPVIDPIIDIFDGLFGGGSNESPTIPTTSTDNPTSPTKENEPIVIIDPATGEPQPEYVLVTPTPIPAPIPVIGSFLDSIVDFFGGNTSTTTLTPEQKQILADNPVSEKPNEVQELFVRASDLISPQIADALGLTPARMLQTQIPDSSEQIITNYLANYQLKIAADHEGNVVVRRGDASVKIPVPIVLNPQSRSFSVMTEQGTVPVTYYPDTVKDELELNRVINADLDMTLGIKNNDIVYVANGCEEEFMFAFLPVCPQKQVVLSARDMNVYSVKQSTISRVVDLLSI
jgi:hypothetical protein